MDQAAANVPPVFRLAFADNKDIGEDPESPQGAPQPHRLRAWVVNSLLDYEEVKVTSRTRVPPGVRPEKHYARTRSCGIQSGGRLTDQLVIEHRTTVAGSASGDNHRRLTRRDRRPCGPWDTEFDVRRHAVLPATGSLLMLLPIYGQLWTTPAWLYNLVPYSIIAWTLAGIGSPNAALSPRQWTRSSTRPTEAGPSTERGMRPAFH